MEFAVMGRAYIFLPFALMVFGATVFAQTPSDGAVSQGDIQQESDAQDKSPKTKGDTVHFKNGRMLAGVQVINETAVSIEVVPAPGVASLTLPQSMVETIEYDDIKDAKGNWLLDDGSGAGKIKLLEGKEISPALYTKITRPLFKEKRAYADIDFKALLEELAGECELVVVFGETVLAMPEEKRAWTIELQPNTSFLNFLQTDFSTSFPEMEWVYQFDKIAVNVKKSVSE